jgi:hypothetical protein
MGPTQPGMQVQLPYRGSHLAPFRQGQAFWQPGPHFPSSHAAKMKNKKNNERNENNMYNL